jgi:hypothetical protein
MSGGVLVETAPPRLRKKLKDHFASPVEEVPNSILIPLHSVNIHPSFLQSE